jgi:hypothetical protein
MRHCKWTVDQENKTLTLSSKIKDKIIEQSTLIPFEINAQYDILIDVEIGRLSVQNLTVDYGSNGPIGVPNDIFILLEQHNSLGDILIEKGVKQSGVIGTAVELNRKSSKANSVSFEQLELEDVEVRSGSSGIIGTKVLSRFLVSMDWDKKALYLKKKNIPASPSILYDFKVSSHPTKGVYIQSVTENTPAYNMGIRPNMKLVKVDTLDFTKDHDLCDFISYLDQSTDQLTIEVIDEKGLKQEFVISKRQ